MTTNEETSEIKNIIERAIEQNPQNSEIIKAFAPIITRQRQLAEQIFFKELDCSLIDKEKLKAGVPVSNQIDLFLPEDPLKEMALSLATAVKEGMPNLPKISIKFPALIQEGKINPRISLSAPVMAKRMSLADWPKNCRYPHPMLHF